MTEQLRCRSCGAKIFWAKTVRGRAIPLDVEPSPKGNIILKGGLAHYITAATRAERADGEAVPEVYLTHFATCPFAGTHRRKEV
jgi:hypothetical protein